jgi:hypothetical protein
MAAARNLYLTFGFRAIASEPLELVMEFDMKVGHTHAYNFESNTDSKSSNNMAMV